MMKPNSMSELLASSQLSGANSAYLEQMYEKFLVDPDSLDSVWQEFFKELPRANGFDVDVNHSDIKAQFAKLGRMKAKLSSTSATHSLTGANERAQANVLQLITAYRTHGHQEANLDPLEMHEPVKLPILTPEHYNLNQADLDKTFNTMSFLGLEKGKLKDIIDKVRQTYCGTIGIEYMHMTSHEEVLWLQQRLESTLARPNYTKDEKIKILEQLTNAEGMEKYLHSRYVGQKRFSSEGAESLIPALNSMIDGLQANGVEEAVMGMAHRGRLNVLVNVFGKSPEELFSEFEGKKKTEETVSGDVKYHQGFSSDVATDNGEIHLALAFNPSHLEIIGPVVQGSVRARQRYRNDSQRDQVVPIVIHGDAAFAGQGVVMETFNMSQARGFTTGGTIHIVINNQVGFTTSNVEDSRSTLYCTDVAKMIEAPIFHVNGDDPEAVQFVTQIALEYRMAFHKDVVVDMVCYRRHGHNEADEPAATQPLMYQIIRKRPTIRFLYAQKLVNESIITQQEADDLVHAYRDALDKGEKVARTVIGKVTKEKTVDWSPYVGGKWRDKGDTAISVKEVERLANNLTAIPDGMVLQPQVAKVMKDRVRMQNGEIPMDWGFAETMAYASLLSDSYHVRLCGQDSGRGTFAHRHAVLNDFKTGKTYIPLEHVSEDQAPLVIIDSLLSEEAVLGFEFGYATTDPHAMVIWEAQFGDFANGAQVVIDQFISSGYSKWARLCGLVMLLPHGFEGQGPEHSSARLERYLQLCAQHNMQVCVPSTPAQNFHMLRRQMVRPFRAPLIVMTPKSLLRHPLAVSDLSDLTEGRFYLAIPEVDDLDPSKVDRVVMCSGKVFYDLLQERRKSEKKNVAIIRIEQLYPFPEPEVKDILAQYPHAKELVWCQEEPMNQGAWYSTRHRFEACLKKGQSLSFAGRKLSASPAVGQMALHLKQQAELVNQALALS